MSQQLRFNAHEQWYLFLCLIMFWISSDRLYRKNSWKLHSSMKLSPWEWSWVEPVSLRNVEDEELNSQNFVLDFYYIWKEHCSAHSVYCWPGLNVVCVCSINYQLAYTTATFALCILVSSYSLCPVQLLCFLPIRISIFFLCSVAWPV